MNNKIKLIRKDESVYTFYDCQYINFSDKYLECRIQRSKIKSSTDDVLSIRFEEYEDFNYYHSKLIDQCHCYKTDQATFEIKETSKDHENKFVTKDIIDMRNEIPAKFIYTFNNDEACNLTITTN